MKKKKKYIPKPRHNPEKQAIRLEELKKEVEFHARNLKTVIKSYDRHVEYLSNFAQHDMKNAIQGMDSILSTTDTNEFDEEIILSLKAYLKLLRETIKDFSKLVPHSINGDFKFTTLMIAVELLTRSDFSKNDITNVFKYDRDSEATINQPFQTLLQVINNLVFNSIKALEDSEKRTCYITGEIIENMCIIKVSDTGIPILEKNLERIFEYGFSTTGGTGIGLYHAKYVCEDMGGNISVNVSSCNECTKEFILKFPIKSIEYEKEHSDY